MTDYSNILKAIAPQTPQMADLERRTENYKLVDQLNQEGVSLKDLLSQVDELKKTVESLKTPQKQQDSSVFLAMEAYVRDDDEIIEAKKRLSDLKSSIILEFCMKDDRYRQAYDDYRTKVSEIYVKKHSEEPSEPHLDP